MTDFETDTATETDFDTQVRQSFLIKLPFLTLFLNPNSSLPWWAISVTIQVLIYLTHFSRRTSRRSSSLRRIRVCMWALRSLTTCVVFSVHWKMVAESTLFSTDIDSVQHHHGHPDRYVHQYSDTARDRDCYRYAYRYIRTELCYWYRPSQDFATVTEISTMLEPVCTLFGVFTMAWCSFSKNS